MPKLTFVMGGTATGKTYFIEQQYGQKDVEVLNVFDYQQCALKECGEKAQSSYTEYIRCLYRANAMLLEDILDRMRRGQDLVVEHTLYRTMRRVAYIDEIRKIPDVFIEVYVMCPSDERWKSNMKKRELEGSFEYYKEIVEAIEFPNVAEGINQIYEVVDDGIKPRMDAPWPELVKMAREELAKETEKMQQEDEEIRKKQELLESMKMRKFWHYCEVCGRKEFITAEEAFSAGWDYPPSMYQFGILTPRTCGNCSMGDTLFFKVSVLNIQDMDDKNLTPKELATLRRIQGEPESLLEEEPEN
jgi:predicted kinase